jgi:uncharacterized protein
MEARTISQGIPRAIETPTSGKPGAGRKTVIALIVAMAAMPRVVAGSSFDCRKAGTIVENMICSSKELSTLDEQLAAAYRSLTLSSGDSEAVREQQRKWLREVRDKCESETCLEGVYRDRLAQLASGRTVRWSSFRDPDLGFEFSYPSSRRVVIGCHGSKHCVALTSGASSPDDYIVAFEVFDGGLRQVAEEHTIFQESGQHWTAKGRSAEHTVERLAGPGWEGLKATVDCGISDKNGFHAGIGECLWVVLSNGKRSIVVDTQGLAGIDEDTMRSIQSIRFSGS